jgi:ABC-type glycerol-3-phosphate transport system substrate-binding protein
MQKMTRRNVLKLMGASASVALLAACQPAVAPATAGGSASAPAAEADRTTINYWFFVGGPNLDNQQKMVDGYNASQEKVEVNLVHEPEIKEKALAALAAGAPPNVTWFPTGGWGALGFAEAGGVIALDDYVAADFADVVPDFYDFLWQANIWQGKVWGVPLDTNNLAWFYNEDLVTAAGLTPFTTNPTWDELVEFLQALTVDTNGDGEPDQWGYQASPEARYFYDFLVQAGGALANEDYSKSLVNSPEGETTLKWLRDMVHEWKISPYPPIDQAFQTGVVATDYEGSYRIPPYRQLTDIKVNAFPTTTNVKPFTVNGGESLQIWATDAATQEASWDFIKYMTSTENVTQWSVASGYLPVRRSAAESADFQAVLADDPIRKVFVDELAYGGFWLATPYGSEAYDAITDAVEQVLLEDANIPDTLAALETRLDEIFAGNI